LGYLVESSPLAELYQRYPKQELIIATFNDIGELYKQLCHYDGIENYQMQPDHNQIKVTFNGTEQEKYQLLRSLLASGFSITEFYTEKQDLENLFLQLDHQQPS